ncbi:MAG: bifunctional 5,10-methylenetetrahydrofolate dehydrogenase/5,10-methenyltetrahydrofolate cyclohydrolase [Candidatus Omnitrophica bacterium]|nr:bifunctional 5,10-methylenetetrahydrofolate dehydrogenase/5,10-methenyltetrahydrofolate cyclohydrolase [Candidatus Omnitrophota bacterium]MCF7894132.1 bifunctional 5,10-methylenetetrahydrofolate dehydrogenase/5,10-methenyltetrahydrofolate cyclohydrolase [Candidatus Omnitrophota bacterium]
MGKIIDIEKIASSLKNELIAKSKALPPVSLASLQFGQSPDAEIYIKSQKRLAKEVGVDFSLYQLSDKISQQEATNKIKELNQDKNIDGIIVNKPFPEGWKPEEIFAAILPVKDIEGVSPHNLGRMFYDSLTFTSPTVLAVLAVIESLNVDLYGKDVTVVGFSTLIGKPLVLLLGQKFATVTVTHIATYQKQKLPFYIKNADLLISAVGKPHFIKGEWIKEGAVVVDVGISKKDSKIVGDIDFEPAIKKAAFVSPVPAGVGRLTSLFLFKNLFKAKKICS